MSAGRAAMWIIAGGIVSEVADGWDDRLASEFGGLRYADLG